MTKSLRALLQEHAERNSKLQYHGSDLQRTAYRRGAASRDELIVELYEALEVLNQPFAAMDSDMLYGLVSASDVNADARLVVAAIARKTLENLQKKLEGGT
jgi:hypothetical protein